MRNRMCRGSSSTIGHRTSGRFRKLAKLMLATAPIAGALFAGGNAFAQSQLTWAPAGADGSGNWDTSTPNWNPGQVDWVNGDSAIFGSGGAAGTVTLQAPIQAVSLTFNSVASGDYLITGSGTNTLTLLSGQSILSNITDGVGPSIGATIAGSSGLTLIGAGTLNLTGNNTYTGTTSIGSGTLIVSSTGNLGAITNALSIGTPTNAGGSVTSVGNLTLNANQTVGGVNVSNNSSGTDSLVLNSTTLTVNGGFNVGFGTTTGTAQTSSLIVSGGGSLVVNGSMDIGGQGTSTNKAVSTTSLAGINSFILNAGSSGSLLIGDGGNIKALLTLANSGSNSSNTITAGSIIIGQSGGSNANAGCALELGGGTNVIDVNTMTIGQGKSAGSMGFPSNAANGVVTIAPISGTGTNITIGDETSGTASSTASSILLAGHTANVTAGTVIVGEQSGDTGGNPGAQVTFDTGNFTMSALELGVMGPSATSATGGSYSFTLGSTASSTGRLTIGTAGTNGTFYLGNISGTGNSTAANTSTNTFNMVGGTANIFANIASTYSSTAKGTAIPILILSGGTLNMEGNNIGTVASGNGFITTNFVPVATQSATLENLGANGINLSGLTLNGAGTLVLEGNNTYTGGTKINSGTLQIGEPTDATGLASSMGTGAVTVGSALTFASSQAVIVGNAIGGGGVINQSGTGLTTLNGSNSFSGNVNVSGGNLSVTGSMTAATTNLSGGVLSGTGVLGNINHSAGAIVPATGLNLLGTLSANNYTFSGGTLAFNIGTSSSSMLDVANATFNAIPNFSFNLVGAPAAGSTFTLVQSASAIADNGNLGSLPASTVGRTTYTPFEQGGPGGTDIDVVVSGGPASLIWNNTGGTGDGLTWDVQTNQNWFNTGTAAADVFYDADNVTFNDNNNGHYTVAVEQTVTPGSVTFANGSNAYTVSGAAISSDGALNVTGTGGVSLSNSSTFASVAINAGSLTIAASGELDSPTVNVAACSSLTIASGATLSGSPALSDNGSVSITTAASTTVSSLNGGGTFAVAGTLVDSAGGSFSGSITDNSGSGSLSVSGGTLSLSGSNTYSGGTSVSSGALLVIASGGSLNPATTLTDAGTVNLQNAAQTISTLNGAGALNLLGDTLTVSNGGTFSGHIADGGAGEVGNIIAAGGTLTLSGTNAYSGTTEVKSGALLKPIGNFALGTGTTVNVDSGGTIDIGGNAVANTVNFGNDVFNISGTGVNGEGALYNSASGITQEDAYNYITLTGNALIGGYRADVGRNVTNGSLNLNGFTLTTNIIGTTNTIFAILNDATVSNGMIIADSPATGTNAGLDFERGAIAGPGVSVIYEPNSSAQFYELAAGSGGGVTAQLTFMGGNFIGNGGSVLSTLPASIILDGNVTFEGMTSGVPTAASTFALTVTGSISDDGNHRSITKLSPNTLTLSGINTWGGATLIQNGDIVLTASSALPANTPLTLGAAATSGQLDLNGNSVSVGSLATSGTGTANDITSSSAATLTFNGGSSTFGGALNNALALNVGSGSLELTGNNNYSGGTTINGGTLQLGSASAMGSTSAPLTVNAGTLDLNGNSPTVGSLSGTGGTIDEVSAGGNVSLTVNQSGTTSFAGSIQNTTGSVALNFNGGSLALTGTNSYTGLTSVNSGQLEIDNPVFMSSQVNVGGSATLALNAVEYGSNTVNSGQITAIQSGPGKITGNISGNGSFNQNGGGPTILFGTNTYTGNTNVNAGELVIGAASALSAATSLTVGSTNTAMAQLGTTGVAFTVSGVTVNSGSTLDLTSNSLTVNYGGSDPVSTIASYLADGFHSGWAAGEINSSSVASLNASQSKLIYSVGYADGADGITNVPSGEIEILPTLAGDAKMQGNVVFGDFQLLSQYFGQSGTSWDEGDFTYNGTTNFGDFQLLSQDFGASASALTAGQMASLDGFASQFGEHVVSNPDGVGLSLVSVPEPTMTSLTLFAAFPLLLRVRRRSNRRAAMSK